MGVDSLRRAVAWIVRSAVDLLFGTVFAIFLGWILRRVGRFSYLLGENAVIGSVDDEIAKHLGITVQAVLAFTWDWLVPVALAAAAIWAYHLIKDKTQQDRSRKLTGLTLIICGGMALLVGIGMLIKVGNNGPTVTGDQAQAVQPASSISEVPLSPELEKLRAELESSRRDTANMSRELNATKAQLTAAQAQPASAPANPMQYVPKDPYQAGPIIDRKYTKKEAEQMIDALAEITEVATQIQRVQFPNEFATFRNSRFRSGSRVNLPQLIKNDGYTIAIGRLNAFITNMRSQQDALQKVIGRYPVYYQPDLNKIIGQTGIGSVLSFADNLLSRLKELAKVQVPPDSPIVFQSLDSAMEQLGDAVLDHNRWRQTFVDNRSPTARAAIEEFLK